jgi:hypothetical protein
MQRVVSALQLAQVHGTGQAWRAAAVPFSSRARRARWYCSITRPCCAAVQRAPAVGAPRRRTCGRAPNRNHRNLNTTQGRAKPAVPAALASKTRDELLAMLLDALKKLKLRDKKIDGARRPRMRLR